jgi:hypothetical protein
MRGKKKPYIFIHDSKSDSYSEKKKACESYEVTCFSTKLIVK